MRTDLSCTLGEVSLLNLDESIYLEDIQEEITVDHETAKRAHYGLVPLTDPERESLTVTITIFIKKRDRAERIAVIQKLLAWATKGYLTISTRSAQRLYVYCIQPPNFKTFDITERVTIKFCAYYPFWESTSIRSTQSTTAATSHTLRISSPGTRSSFLEGTVTNGTGGVLTTVSISCGTQVLELTGLSIPTGSELSWGYDDMHNLWIKSGTTSLLPNRTAQSVDDIMISVPTVNTITVSTNVGSSVKVQTRGMYL